MKYLRKAETDEAGKILDFYKEIIKSSKTSEFKPKWNEKYPDLDFIKTSIENEDLFIYEKDDTLISCVIVNNVFDERYSNVKWNVTAEPSEITIIHTFAVHPKFSNKGIGREIFNEIKETAINNNQKALRIDVIDGNIGACKVFKKLGFEYIESVEVTHEAVGKNKFHLFEYVLK